MTYQASKQLLRSASHALADCAARPVRVTLLEPDRVDTPMLHLATHGKQPSLAFEPGRVMSAVQPAEIAKLIWWLYSNPLGFSIRTLELKNIR